LLTSQSVKHRCPDPGTARHLSCDEPTPQVHVATVSLNFRNPKIIHQNLSQTASTVASVSTDGGASKPQSFLADNAGTDALLFKDNKEFWFETVRLFGAAEYGGALFGKVIASTRNIRSGDYDSWHDAHSAVANRLADEAASQLKKGHTISARDNYLRACSYDRSAEFFSGRDQIFRGKAEAGKTTSTVVTRCPRIADLHANAG
jgi:hypothetical protein